MRSVWLKSVLVVMMLGTGLGIHPVSWAQTTTAQCQTRQDNLVREWLERSRTHVQYGRTEPATKALLRAFQAMGQNPNSRQRMEMLQMIIEEQPTGLLNGLMALAQRDQRADLALSVLPVVLSTAQSLPTAYSAVKTQTLTAIANDYLSFGYGTEARDILGQATTAASFLQGAEFQTKALTAISKVYIPLGDPTQALTLLDQSLQAAQQMQHPHPFRHAWVLEPIALAYAQLDAFDQSLRVAELIQQRDASLQSNAEQVLAVVVRGYGKNQQLPAATQLLTQITSPEIKVQVLTDLASQRQNFGAITEAQQFLQQAIATAQQEQNEGLRNNLLSQMIRTYAANTAQVELALPLMRHVSDPATQALIFSEFATITLNPDQSLQFIEQGLAVAQQITDDYQRGILFNQLIEQHFTAQRWAIALPLIQALPEDDPFADKYSQLSRLAKAAADTGDFPTALAAIDSLPANWEDNRNQGWQQVAVGYAQQGDFTRALELFPRITNSGSYPYQVRTLGAIADQAQQRGNPDLAKQLFSQAQAITDKLDFNLQKADALTTLAILAKTLGQPTQAQQFQAQALKEIQRDPSFVTYPLQEMIKQYLAAKDYRTAVQVAIAIPNVQQEQTWILNQLAEQLIEAEQFETALQATESIPIPEDKARFLMDLANYYLFKGDLNAVNHVLDQALTTAKTIPGAESRQLVFRAPPDQTIVDDPYDRGSTLEAIALKYADIGQTAKARQIAQQLTDATIRNPLMQQLNCDPSFVTVQEQKR